MAYTIQEFKDFFQAVEPIILKLETDHPENALQFVYNKITQASTNLILKLETFLTHPLVDLLLKENLTVGERQIVVECIVAVKAKTSVKSVPEFLLLYSLTCEQIFDVKSCNLKTGVSEELKLSAVKCLTLLITRADDELLVHLYGKEPLVLGQAVYLAVQIISKEKSTKLRCSALELLLAISQYGGDKNKKTLEKVADTFAKLAPGVIGPLTDVATKSLTANHQVIVLTVRCWGHIIRLVLQDFPENGDKHVDEIALIKSWMKQDAKAMEQIEAKQILSQGVRNQKWASSAAQTLQRLFNDLTNKCVKHHSEVRMELISVCENILTDCYKTLGPASGVFLDALVYLRNDDYPNIQDKSRDVLQALETKNYEIMSLAHDRLALALDQLSRHLRLSITSDEVVQSLSLISSYLDLFPMTGKKSAGPCIITNPLLLSKLIDLLTIALTIQYHDEILHQYDNEPTDFGPFCLQDSKPIHVMSKKSEQYLNRIFSHIAFWSFEHAIHSLIGQQSLESLAALNRIISQKINLEATTTEFLVQYFIDSDVKLYTSEENVPKTQKSKLLKAMFVVQGIGYLSKSLGQEFETYLLKTLYLITEKLGSSYSLLRVAAFSAAKTIAKSCNYPNVETLTENNLDYLTHHIVIKLKRNSDQSVLDATRVVAKLCGTKVLPQLEDVVGSILSSSLVFYNHSDVKGYLRVFLAFVLCASKEPDPSLSPNEHTQPSPIQQLLEYITKKRNDNEDDQSTEETKLIPPGHVSITVNVIQRCLHYLPICSDSLKVLCLKVLDTGLKVLADWEDQLLPLVHQIWSPLVHRFDPKTQPLVIRPSFQLLCTLTLLAKDFIRHRTLKEVLPMIRDFLVNSSKISRNHAKDIAYHTTQNYKLQRELLTGLGGMTCDLKLHERETDWIVEAAHPFLSKSQPKILQTCAVGLYRKLLTYDPVLVAYRLQPLKTNDEFQKSVQQILG